MASISVTAFNSSYPEDKPDGRPDGTSASEILETWQSYKYGMFIHFGMATFTGRADENDPRNAQEPSALYAPSRLDVEQWVRVARDAGMEYAVLTAKHTAGHCLWDSQVQFRGKAFDYDVATSGNRTDVVAEFVKACKKYDIAPGLYWCLLDFHNNSVPPKPQWNARNLPDDYYRFTKDQLTELIQRYPEVGYYWLDIPRAASASQRRDIYDMIKRLRPGTLVVYNHGTAQPDGPLDIETFQDAWPTDVLNTERHPCQPGQFKAEQPWRGAMYRVGYEHCDTIVKRWFWTEDDELRPIPELHKLYREVMAAGGNFLLNVPPDKTGRIPHDTVNALMDLQKEIGESSSSAQEEKSGLADLPGEIRRTHPDFLLFDPTGGEPPPWNDPDFFWLNEHILVQPNGHGELLAMWTSQRLKPWKWSIKYAHSRDGGSTWTDAKVLDGPKAAWQVPVVSPTGRIYVFMTHGFTYGGMRCYTSDDGGHTWSDPIELAFAKGPTDHPDKGKKASWISPTIPHWDSHGRPLIGFTRWATHPKYPIGITGNSQIEYFRIENLAKSPAPQELEITWLHVENPITVPHSRKKGFSYAQEPYTVALPDGRLMVVMRTDTGHIWYSVSSDEGETWRQAEPLRYRDGGEALKNPVSPCPIFALERGDYVLLYNNNDGTGHGLKGPEDRAARRPAYLARGEFRPDAHQPIWFSEPTLFIDNDAVPWGPPGRERLEAATYVSLTEEDGRRVLWYPDRKSFLLGKRIPDSLLDAMKVPE